MGASISKHLRRTSRIVCNKELWVPLARIGGWHPRGVRSGRFFEAGWGCFLGAKQSAASLRLKVGRKVGIPILSTQVFDIIEYVAETEGFEPSVPNYQYDGLANRWFQPLTHVSSALGIGGL